MSPDLPLYLFFLSYDSVAGFLIFAGCLMVAVALIRYRLRINLTSWLLWCCYGLVATAATRFPVPLIALAAGTLVVTLTALATTTWTWRVADIVWVGLSLGVALSQLYWTPLTGAVAMLIAGIPQLRESWQKPEPSLVPCFVLVLIGMLSLVAGHGTTDPSLYAYPAAAAAYAATLLGTMLASDLISFRNLVSNPMPD